MVGTAGTDTTTIITIIDGSPSCSVSDKKNKRPWRHGAKGVRSTEFIPYESSSHG
jgi:hypothetical protein